MGGAAVPNFGPTPSDLCAVAINIAARMSYRTYCAWVEETDQNAEAAIMWEDLPQEQRANAVGFVMQLAANPYMDLENIHELSVQLAGDQMPEDMQCSYDMCPPHYRASMAMSVAVIRAVLDNLVSRRDMKDYMNALDSGTDAFMLEN